MQIIRNDVLIQRRKKIGQYTSLVGIAVLIGGMVLMWMGPNWDIPVQVILYVPFLALLVGFILSQIGIFYSNRYVRSPRPDELLDQSLKGMGQDYKLYHYFFPVPHLLLAPSGLIVPITRTESGSYTIDGGKWKQKFSAARVLNFMGREGLGNPAKDADYHEGQLRRFLQKNAPELAEAPIQPVVVFLSEKVQLDVGEDVPIQVVRAAKFKGLLRGGLGETLPKADYRQLEAFLDEAAGVA